MKPIWILGTVGSVSLIGFTVEGFLRGKKKKKSGRKSKFYLTYFDLLYSHTI